MKETDFAKKITRNLRDCNALVLSVVGNRMQQNSWPDIYVAHVYWSGWIEFKGLKTKLRKDQKVLIEGLQIRGANAVIVRAPDKIEDAAGALLSRFDPKFPVNLLRVLQELSCKKD